MLWQYKRMETEAHHIKKVQLPNNACIPFAMNVVYVRNMNMKIEILMFKNGKIKRT